MAFLRANRVVSYLVAAQLASGFDFSELLGSSSGTKHAVDELTDSTFHKYLKENTVTAVLFYAPWCFYSQQIMPSWDTAAQKLDLHDPPVRLAKIDTSRYQQIGEEHEIHAYPTMKLFVDDSVFEFDGQGRGWQQIVKWVNMHIERDHILKSMQDAETYLHDNELNVVGLFPDGYESGNFMKSARHYADIVFAEAKGDAIAKEVADYLGKHAGLVCESIFLGQSAGNTKSVDLPREGMHCSNSPANLQRPEWSDKFEASVTGKTLSVKRADQTGGWQQILQMKCCDDEAKAQKEHPVFSVPSVVMFMPHDERHAVFDGDINDIHALDKFISARRTPLVMRMEPDTADKLFAAGPENIPALFLITPNGASSEEKIFREAAPLVRGKVHMCISGMTSPIERRTAEMAGIDDPSTTAIALVETHGGSSGGGYHAARKYRLPTEGLSADKIVKFVTDYHAGSLTPWLKSELEPTAEDIRLGGPVGVLVGTTFTKVSQDPEQDVMVDFYAPWCGHCRKFEPNYKELAKKLKHVKTLKITKLDATRNEVEGMQITGFPTIVLFKAGSSPKQQVFYSGNRQPDDMVRWLQQECTIKFDKDPPPKVEGDEPVESGLLDPDEEDL